MTKTRSNSAYETEDESAALNLDKLSADGKLIVAAITAQLDIFKEDFLKKLAIKDKQIDSLKLEINTLHVKVANLEERIDDADAYERRDAIVISGNAVPQFQIGENCNDIVCNLVKNALKLKMNPSDISTSHRLGKKPTNQQPDRRNIIAKLCRRDLKREIINTCRQNKPDNLFVNEHLTPLRNTIMYALRKLKGRFPAIISGSTSIDGRVFVWIKKPTSTTSAENTGNAPKNTRIPINTKFKLEDFCKKTLKVSLSSIIKDEDWPYE